MEMVMMIGRILTDGRMSARVKYDVNDRFSIKANAQVCFYSAHEDALYLRNRFHSTKCSTFASF